MSSARDDANRLADEQPVGVGDEHPVDAQPAGVGDVRQADGKGGLHPAVNRVDLAR